MELTEQKIFEALGVHPEGAQAQDPATPAAHASSPDQNVSGAAGNEGAQVQDPADPADGSNIGDTSAQNEPTAGAAAPDDPASTASTGSGTSSGELTPEQRKAYAAQRRAQERQAAIDAAVQAEREKNQAEMTEFFKAAGLKNTFTGEPITSVEQFHAWNEKFQGQKLQDDLRAGKLTPETLDQAISNHPAIKKANEVIRKSEEQQRIADQEAARVKVNEQITQIGQMDPSIGSVTDLMNKPWYPEFYGYVKRGFTLTEAYRQVNHQAMVSAAAEAARQQAINNSRGKDHLGTIGGARGAGAINVPPEEMALFRKFMPNATEAEIQAYYNNYKK